MRVYSHNENEEVETGYSVRSETKIRRYGCNAIGSKGDVYVYVVITMVSFGSFVVLKVGLVVGNDDKVR